MGCWACVQVRAPTRRCPGARSGTTRRRSRCVHVLVCGWGGGLGMERGASGRSAFDSSCVSGGGRQPASQQPQQQIVRLSPPHFELVLPPPFVCIPTGVRRRQHHLPAHHQPDVCQALGGARRGAAAAGRAGQRRGVLAHTAVLLPLPAGGKGLFDHFIVSSLLCFLLQSAIRFYICDTGS